MKPVDWIILGCVLLGVCAAAFFAVRRRRKGKCCGDCAGCAGCAEQKQKNG